MLESPCSRDYSQAKRSFRPAFTLDISCPPSHSWPESRHAGVAKLAYAQDLKSCSPKGEYGFDPRLLHHSAEAKSTPRTASALEYRNRMRNRQRSGSDDEVIEEDRLIGRYAMVGFDVPL